MFLPTCGLSVGNIGGFHLKMIPMNKAMPKPTKNDASSSLVSPSPLDEGGGSFGTATEIEFDERDAKPK